jgi:hypothetical protein
MSRPNATSCYVLCWDAHSPPSIKILKKKKIWAEYIKMSVEGKGRLLLRHMDIRWPQRRQFRLVEVLGRKREISVENLGVQILFSTWLI